MKYEAYDKTGEILNDAGKVVIIVPRGGAHGFGGAAQADRVACRYVELLNSEAWDNGNNVVAREVDSLRDELIHLGASWVAA